MKIDSSFTSALRRVAYAALQTVGYPLVFARQAWPRSLASVSRYWHRLMLAIDEAASGGAQRIDDHEHVDPFL
jgi:hypothetical protein